ncbi:MAG: cysteine desulfurase [Methanomassiliicoccales archaeon]
MKARASYELKKDFPLFSAPGNEKLVYLDSAATSQKPESVLKAVADFERTVNANVHRGMYSISIEATERFERAREKVAAFINASPEEVIFVRGATEGLNIVALALGIQRLNPGDEVLLTRMEHHSNIIPWQLLRWKGIKVRYAPVTAGGLLDVEAMKSLIGPRTRAVSLTHVSNVLGTINPVREIADIAHERGAVVIVDGAQSVPHIRTDAVKLGGDFLAFSGHKMCAPNGIGVLWGRRQLLEELEPVFGGGEMISEVGDETSSWAELPHKFEAGTPNVSGAIGLGAAVDYLESVGMDYVERMERDLLNYALERMKEVRGMEIYGPQDQEQRCGVISFNLSGVHNHDVSDILAAQGVAIRAGHHCAMPLMHDLGVPGTARISFYLYNTRDDVDAFIRALAEVERIFG